MIKDGERKRKTRISWCYFENKHPFVTKKKPDNTLQFQGIIGLSIVTIQKPQSSRNKTSQLSRL